MPRKIDLSNGREEAESLVLSMVDAGEEYDPIRVWVFWPNSPSLTVLRDAANYLNRKRMLRRNRGNGIYTKGEY